MNMDFHQTEWTYFMWCIYKRMKLSPSHQIMYDMVDTYKKMFSCINNDNDELWMGYYDLRYDDDVNKMAKQYPIETVLDYVFHKDHKVFFNSITKDPKSFPKVIIDCLEHISHSNNPFHSSSNVKIKTISLPFATAKMMRPLYQNSLDRILNKKRNKYGDIGRTFDLDSMVSFKVSFSKIKSFDHMKKFCLFLCLLKLAFHTMNFEITKEYKFLYENTLSFEQENTVGFVKIANRKMVDPPKHKTNNDVIDVIRRQFPGMENQVRKRLGLLQPQQQLPSTKKAPPSLRPSPKRDPNDRKVMNIILRMTRKLQRVGRVFDGEKSTYDKRMLLRIFHPRNARKAEKLFQKMDVPSALYGNVYEQIKPLRKPDLTKREFNKILKSSFFL